MTWVGIRIILYQACNELTKEEIILKALVFLKCRVVLFSGLSILVAWIVIRHVQGNYFSKHC